MGEMVVWYFIRHEYEDKFDCDIPSGLKQLIIHFSKRMIGCNMLTFQEDIKFYNLLSARLGHRNFKLLFRASEHGFSASAFHKFCDGYGPSLTIIESNFGNIFGGYTSIKWGH